MRDFDLKKETFFISRSKRFNNVYEVLVNKKIFTMSELFTFVASTGFKKRRRINFSHDKGKDIRSEFFFDNHLMVLYSIILNDPSIGKELNVFKNINELKKAMKIVEEYAEGGMEILCEEVFLQHWDYSDNLLDKSYNEYEIDLMNFVQKEYATVTF